MLIAEVTILRKAQEALSVKSVSRGLDRICVTFDEPNLVANAGLLLVATLVRRLGLERLINEKLRSSWTSRWRVAGSQGVHARARDHRRCEPHRPRERAARRSDTCRCSPSGDGTVDARDVPPLVHLRPRPTARFGDRRSDPSCLGNGGWSDRAPRRRSSTRRSVQ